MEQAMECLEIAHDAGMRLTRVVHLEDTMNHLPHALPSNRSDRQHSSRSARWTAWRSAFL